jgi:hypothetical protein
VEKLINEQKIFQLPPAHVPAIQRLAIIALKGVPGSFFLGVEIGRYEILDFLSKLLNGAAFICREKQIGTIISMNESRV